MAKIQLLYQNDRKIIGIGSIALLALTLLEATGVFRLTHNDISSMQFLAKFVFFNHMHIYLMYFYVLFTKVGEKYLSETIKTKNYHKNPFIAGALIFPILVISYVLLIDTPSFRYYFVAIGAFSGWHSGRQIWGLYLDFFSSSARKKDFQLKFTKWIFHASLLLSILNFVIISGKLFFLAKYLPFLLTAMLSLSTLFILQALRYRDKILVLYCTRLLTMNFAPSYNFAQFAMSALHGIEYLLLFKNTLGKQHYKFANKASSYFWLFTLALVLFGEFYFIALSKSLVPNLSNKSISYIFLFNFTFTATVTHFYIEAYLFRFTDPLVKSTLAKLFHYKQPIESEQSKAA